MEDGWKMKINLKSANHEESEKKMQHSPNFLSIFGVSENRVPKLWRVKQNFTIGGTSIDGGIGLWDVNMRNGNMPLSAMVARDF